MTELEQAIAAVKSDVAANGPHPGIHNLSTILNAIATGQLVPAQAWQGMDSAPRDGTQILASLWAYGQPGGERRYEVVSWECDGWASEAYPIYPPTHWMPIPVAPTEGGV